MSGYMVVGLVKSIFVQLAANSARRIIARDPMHTCALLTGPKKERIHRGADIFAVVAIQSNFSIELLRPTDHGASAEQSWRGVGIARRLPSAP